MRDCKEYREWIQAFTDGFLSRDEEQELKAHVKTCTGCTAYLREMAAYRKAAMELMEDVPEELHERILDDYYREKQKTNRPAIIRFLRRNPFVATAAVFVLVIGTVFAGGQLKNAGQSADTATAEMAVPSTTAAMAYMYNNVYVGEMEPETTQDNASVTQFGSALDGSAENGKGSATMAATAAATKAPTGTEALRKSPAADMEQMAQVLADLDAQADLPIPDVEVEGVFGWLLVVKTDGLPSKVLELGMGQIITTDVEYGSDLVTISQVAVDPEALEPLLNSAPGCEYMLYTDEQPWLDDQIATGLVMLVLPNE